MVHGKLSQIAIKLETKVNRDELNIVKNNSLTVEEMKAVEDKVKALEYQLFQLEGEDNEEEDSDLEGTEGGDKNNRFTKNIYGFGEEYWGKLMEEKEAG